MSDELKLSLDRDSGKKNGGRTALIVLVSVAAALAAANLVLQVAGGGTVGRGKGLPPGDLEDLALKLENLSLHSAAAEAWTDYLQTASPGGDERARIWYRIGREKQEAGDCEGALSAYYRSEATSKIPDIEHDISLRIEECLSELGKFAAMRSELKSRTAVPGAGEPDTASVLAEIGNWKITRSDIEGMIETEIEAQLVQAAGGMPPDQVRAKKEELLDDVLKKGRMAEWVDRFIAEELLYRYAMESGLSDDPEVKRYSRNMERKLLAQTALDREYAEKVKVTDEMIRSWYDANKKSLADKDGNIPTFEEARDRAWAEVRRDLEMKAQSALLARLRDKYDVVIHRSALGDEGAGTEESR